MRAGQGRAERSRDARVGLLETFGGPPERLVGDGRIGEQLEVIGRQRPLAAADCQLVADPGEPAERRGILAGESRRHAPRRGGVLEPLQPLVLFAEGPIDLRRPGGGSAVGAFQVEARRFEVLGANVRERELGEQSAVALHRGSRPRPEARSPGPPALPRAGRPRSAPSPPRCDGPRPFRAGRSPTAAAAPRSPPPDPPRRIAGVRRLRPLRRGGTRGARGRFRPTQGTTKAVEAWRGFEVAPSSMRMRRP